MLQFSRDIAFRLSLFDGLALVSLFLSAGNGDAELYISPSRVDFKRNDCEPLCLLGFSELGNLFLRKEKAAISGRIEIPGSVLGLVRRDLAIEEICFASAYSYMRPFELSLVRAQALHFATEQFQTRLEGVEDLEVECRPLALNVVGHAVIMPCEPNIDNKSIFGSNPSGVCSPAHLGANFGQK